MYPSVRACSAKEDEKTNKEHIEQQTKWRRQPMYWWKPRSTRGVAAFGTLNLTLLKGRDIASSTHCQRAPPR